MKYTRQIRNFDCGPTVFVNILKWAGIPVSYSKDYDRFHRLLECGRHTPSWQKRVWGKNARGARPAWLNIKLREYAQETERFKLLHSIDKVDFRRIRYHVSRGRAVLVNYQWKHEKPNGKKIRGGHYFLIIGLAGSGFYTVNDNRKGPALQLYSARHLRQRIYNDTSSGFHPMATIITRNLP